MAISKYHNVTGATGVDVELIAPGSKGNNLSSVMLTNVHATADATVTLFIQDNPTASASSTFNIIHTIAIPADSSLLLDNSSVLSFDNSSSTSFGLYITVGSSDTVDVLLGI